MPEELIDAAAVTSRFVLAFVFLSAAIPKLLRPFEFERAVENYRLLPSRLVRPLANWLPRLELVGALAVLVGVAVAPIALVMAVLLVGFATAIGINLARGRSIDCGCFNSTVPRKIRWRLVVGDIVLASAAVLVAVVPEPSVARADVVAFSLVAAAVVLGQQLGRFIRQIGLTIAAAVGAGALAPNAYATLNCCRQDCGANCSGGQVQYFCVCTGISQDYCGCFNPGQNCISGPC